MQTACIRTPSAFASVDGRVPIAGSGRGTITSDAGPLPLGAPERAGGLVRRSAARLPWDDRRTGRS